MIPLAIEFGWVLENPEIGWVGVFLYLLWEIRGPRGRINELFDWIKSVSIVVRALAQVHDEIDTEKVDDYLTRNGTEPNDFIEDDGNTAYGQRTRRADGGEKPDEEDEDDPEGSGADGRRLPAQD